MKFGHFSLGEALGAILAHSIATPEGILKKGRVLNAADLARLAAAEHTQVVAARLQEGDIGEDEAAHRIAVASAGPGVRIAPPFTGRANLYADAAGLAAFDAPLVAAVNGLSEEITLATLLPFERVGTGQMIATVKVITFSVPESIVAKAEAMLKAGPSLAAVHTFAKKAAGLIPAALMRVGGEVVRLGMPVDPGNLILLGRIGTTAPSCAASAKLNGFDWVLQRRLAGLRLGMTEMAAMGLGGLLKEIPARPQPREEP
jgi:molybdenum cofactor cytidylyltransferase